MSDHPPAHRGGHCGVVGVNWVYATPGELEKARRDAAAIARVRELISPEAEMAALPYGYGHGRYFSEADITASLDGAPEPDVCTSGICARLAGHDGPHRDIRPLADSGGDPE
jgi:hypothetical protein